LLAGDMKTARDVATFLLTRQQQADGSMPRNSLVNGKPAPDTFNVQLDETSYPLLMAHQLGMTDAHALPAAHQARRQLRHQPWPELWPGALGGTGRIFAVDHRRRDRRLDCRG